MFGTARWRLTLWFTLALGIILVIISAAVYFTARATLFDQVNNDLESRAGREQVLLAPRILGRQGSAPPNELVIGPAFTAGGYFYALVGPTGELLVARPTSIPPAWPIALPCRRRSRRVTPSPIRSRPRGTPCVCT